MKTLYYILIIILITGFSCKNKNNSSNLTSSQIVEKEIIDTTKLNNEVIKNKDITSITDSGKTTDIGFVYCSVEKFPVFGNGFEDLKKYITDNIEYPQSAINDSIQGRVYISCIIMENGSIGKVNVLRGLQNDIDNECLRVVQMMSKWTPGRQMGKAVKVQMVIPIKFSLDTTIISYGSIIYPKQIPANTVDLNVKMYPNPASDNVTIEILDCPTDMKYQIISSKGQIIKSSKLFSDKEFVDISDLTNGFYIVRFISNSNVLLKTEKLIIKNK